LPPLVQLPENRNAEHSRIPGVWNPAWQLYQKMPLLASDALWWLGGRRGPGRGHAGNV